MKKWLDLIATKDNLFHALAAVGLVVIVSLVFGSAFAIPAALTAGAALYVRELVQADFDAKFSAHKHAEWATGTAAALIASLVVTVL